VEAWNSSIKVSSGSKAQKEENLGMVAHLHWKITVRQKTLPCIVTTMIARSVILRQNIVALESILLTSISIDSFVSVQAAPNTTSVPRTILRPVTT
jgi:hypothetical protein